MADLMMTCLKCGRTEEGDQRGSGTNLHETMEDAVKDFEEVIGYSMDNSEDDDDEL